MNTISCAAFTFKLKRLACVLACALLAACSTVEKNSAQAELMGQTVRTTVDSELARYYLEVYLQGRRDNSALDAKIAALHHQHHGRTATRETLKAMADESSVDFASLYLADQLLSEGCNRRLNQDFARHLQNPPKAGIPMAGAANYLVLFVPGWDYAENGHETGADFAKPRELATRYGMENHLVALRPTGSVEDNAAVLAAAIAQHSDLGKKILLVGASSGGPAIHLALGELVSGTHRTNVKAWLNLGGILQGSPLVDYFQVAPRCWLLDAVLWFKGWRKDAVLGMGTSISRARFARLQLPADMLVINYLGIPLSGQISRHAADKYPLLRAAGPNDGLTLLTDAIAPGSLTVVALGRDHFFAEDPQINEKTVALMQLLITYLDQDLARSCKT